MPVTPMHVSRLFPQVMAVMLQMRVAQALAITLLS